MTALSFTVTDAGRAEIINANNTGTGPVTITHIALGSGQYTPAKAQSSLQLEFKRLSVFGGEVVADDVIHVTITDDGPDQYTLGEFGLISDKGTLIAVYAQTTPILEKNAEGIVLLSADMTLTSIDANSITFGPAEFVYPPASLTRAGVVVLSNAINSTSQTQAATPQAVKTVNDALEDHKAAGSAHTKGQVGLGSVEDYPMASQAEAEAGSSLIRYMSPIRVKQAIDKFIGTATQAALNTKETPAGAQAKVDAHGNRTDNPHNVTKAQVGLGSVENYPMASQAETEAGSSLIRYMSPIRVKQAIDKFIGTATQAALNTKETPAGAQAKVDTHGNRTDNPHGVTKAQVGLGSVENYPQASQAEAEDATANNRYMTPLRVRQAYQKFGLGTHGVNNAVTDLNAISESGWYGSRTTTLNIPVMSDGVVLHSSWTASSGGRACQIFFASNIYRSYIRHKGSGGVWGEWGEMAHTGNMPASLLENGYQKLPSGLILQWGVFAGGLDEPVSITFPIAFPNAAFNVSLSIQQVTYPEMQADHRLDVGSLSPTTFGVTRPGTPTNIHGFYWSAIGH